MRRKPSHSSFSHRAKPQQFRAYVQPQVSMETANSVTLPQHSHLFLPCLSCDTLPGTEESHERLQWVPLPNDNPNGVSCLAACYSRAQYWGREHLPLHLLKGFPNVRMPSGNKLGFYWLFFPRHRVFLPPLTWLFLSAEGTSLGSAFICVHTHTCQQQKFLCPRVITTPFNPHISPGTSLTLNEIAIPDPCYHRQQCFLLLSSTTQHWHIIIVVISAASSCHTVMPICQSFITLTSPRALLAFPLSALIYLSWITSPKFISLSFHGLNLKGGFFFDCTWNVSRYLWIFFFLGI